MNHAQATEIIQTCSRIASASAPAHADASPHVAPLRLHQTDLDAAAARHDPHHDVRRGVLRRLAALRDRISAAGAAVLPPKGRYVRFSDASSYISIPSNEPDSSSNKPDSCSITESRARDLNVSTQLEQTTIFPERTNASTTHDDPKAHALSDQRSMREFDARIFFRTEHRDRPSPATWATFALIQKLVKQGTMDHAQAFEIIRRCPRIGAPVHADVTHHDAPRPSREFVCAKAAAYCGSDHDPGIRPICCGVLLRLESLIDCISTTGAAILPPSCAAMGPPFLPALDFLSTLILDSDADAESSPTAAAAVAASGDADCLGLHRRNYGRADAAGRNIVFE
eukprot:CAMPEP_0172203482 /NCGR_PEP_ID=MMETSP1050-20130122/31314_1 /TAXON_ID=233186 /ORGANISM="Cryptomonas curvata, Strain CCAP979/52" /LENGTH=339 /DNA_ID=CAMNT_0012881713 /DNA_START=302 /DNA_END=1321 /DNA_ORIENTATION=+